MINIVLTISAYFLLANKSTFWVDTLENNREKCKYDRSKRTQPGLSPSPVFETPTGHHLISSSDLQSRKLVLSPICIAHYQDETRSVSAKIICELEVCNFFCKEILGLTLLLWCRDNMTYHRQYVNKWVAMCSNKTSFINTETQISCNFHISQIYIFCLIIKKSKNWLPRSHTGKSWLGRQQVAHRGLTMRAWVWGGQGE